MINVRSFTLDDALISQDEVTHPITANLVNWNDDEFFEKTHYLMPVDDDTHSDNPCHHFINVSVN